MRRTSGSVKRMYEDMVENAKPMIAQALRVSPSKLEDMPFFENLEMLDFEEALRLAPTQEVKSIISNMMSQGKLASLMARVARLEKRL